VINSFLNAHEKELVKLENDVICANTHVYEESIDDPKIEEIWYIGLEDLDNFVRAVKCFRLGILNKLEENFLIIPPKQ
jgi:hypothetical protein